MARAWASTSRHQAAGKALAARGGGDPEALDLAKARFDGFQRDTAEDRVARAGDQEDAPCGGR
jgi:hypothetical protein